MIKHVHSRDGLRYPTLKPVPECLHDWRVYMKVHNYLWNDGTKFFTRSTMFFIVYLITTQEGRVYIIFIMSM